MAMMVMVIMTNQNVTVDKMQEAYLFTLSLFDLVSGLKAA